MLVFFANGQVRYPSMHHAILWQVLPESDKVLQIQLLRPHTGREPYRNKGSGHVLYQKAAL